MGRMRGGAGTTRGWAASLLWAAVYAASVAVGRATIPPDGIVALVWPAAGVAAVWLLASRHRARDVLLVGLATTALNAVQLSDPRMLAVFAVVNMAQVVVFATVLERLLDRSSIGHLTVRSLGRVLAAALVAVLVAVTLLGLGLDVGPGAPGAGADLAVFAGRNYSALVVVVVAWWVVRGAARAEWRTAGREFASPVVVSASIATVLVYLAAAHLVEAPLAFLLMLLTFWVGSTVSVLGATLFAVAASTLALGYVLVGTAALPTAVDDPMLAAVVTQLFLLSSFLVTVMTALVHADRDRLVRRLDAASRASGQQAQLLMSVLGSLHERITVLDAAGHAVVTTPGTEAVDPELLGDFRYDVHRRVLAGEEVAPTDVVVHDGEGRRRVVQVSATPLRDAEDGELFAAVVVKTDVTRERDEEERLASFAGSVAHDLRNPLSACTSWAELAQNVLEAEEPDLPTARKAVGRVLTSGRRAHDVVDGLLRHATAGGALRPDVVDAGVLVRSVVADRGLEPWTTVEALPVLVGDPVLLRQVFENLLGNAAKYVRQGQDPRIRVSGGEGPGYVQVVVDDEGVGVPEAAREDLFEQFTRAHADRYAGNGLGLAICRSIVERHGGTIRVEGNPTGTGSRFVVTLPAASSWPHPDTPAEAVAASPATLGQA